MTKIRLTMPRVKMSRADRNPWLGKMQFGRLTNRTPARFEYIYCTLFPLSFKLGNVSIPKRRIFLPLFLFCAYDSSVLQNFKIFTHLLPNFSYKDPRLTEVTYHCINFNDRVRKVPYLNFWNFRVKRLNNRTSIEIV